MPYCVLKGCKNSSHKQKSEDGISFHRFPVDPDVRKYWVYVVRQNRKDETWLASKFCVICSAHFKEDDIYFKGKRRYRCLKKKAKPQLLVEPRKINKTTYEEAGPSHERSTDKMNDDIETGPSNERTTDKMNDDKETGPSNERTTDNMNDDKETGPSNERTTAVDNFDDINDSDLESIYDTPRKHKIRKELRRQKLVSAIQKKKIKNLQQKVRRLKKRNASLKNILKELYYILT